MQDRLTFLWGFALAPSNALNCLRCNLLKKKIAQLNAFGRHQWDRSNVRSYVCSQCTFTK